MMQIVAAQPVLLNYNTNGKVNDKRDITVSLSSSDVEINPGSHLKSLTYVKTINDDHVSGEFTVNDKLTPDLRKQLENEDINTEYKKFYILSPLPSVPDDIDDLFEYVNKQGSGSSNPNNVIHREDESLEENGSSENVDNQKSITRNHSEENLRYLDPKGEEYESQSDYKKGKIYGDAEVIDDQSTLLGIKSQKLHGIAVKSNKKFANSFSSDSSNSPYDKYINNESNESLNSNKSPTTVSPYVAPALKKENVKLHSPKEGRILSDEIKYILLIRKN